MSHGQCCGQEHPQLLLICNHFTPRKKNKKSTVDSFSTFSKSTDTYYKVQSHLNLYHDFVLFVFLLTLLDLFLLPTQERR